MTDIRFNIHTYACTRDDDSDSVTAAIAPTKTKKPVLSISIYVHACIA